MIGRGDRFKRVALLAVVLLASGCAVIGPQRAQIGLQAPSDLAAGTALSGTTTRADAWPTERWWATFDDEQLGRLIDEALAGAPSLQTAQARLARAAALTDSARASLWPQVNAAADATRERSSENATVPRPFAGRWISLYDLGASVGYEVDLWGKNRAAWQSAVGQQRAAAADAAQAALVLAVNVARGYLQLQRAFAQRDVAARTLAQRIELAALTTQRVAGGLDTRVELRQADAAVEAARGQLAAIDESIALLRNQIAALLGQGPDRGLALAQCSLPASDALALPSVLPAELLGRRPDLMASRWRVEAAARDVDVARALFYPSLDLNALVGWQSIGLSDLLRHASLAVQVGPAVRLPVFDGGRLRANLAGRRADLDVAITAHNQSVVDALREVVDQIASSRSLQVQLTHQRAALTAADDAYNLAVARYRTGLGNYLQVLSAEAQVLTQRGLEVDLRARALDVRLVLIRALGGGYTPDAVARAAADPQPDTVLAQQRND